MGYNKEDLIGATGSITKQFSIVDAKKDQFGGWDIRVSENGGDEYWTTLEDSDISLD